MVQTFGTGENPLIGEEIREEITYIPDSQHIDAIYYGVSQKNVKNFRDIRIKLKM